MIEVTRTNSRKIIINCDLIEFIESTPDVVITMTTGTKVLVVESILEIIEKVIAFKKNCNILNKSEII